jgi:chemotaxis protein histidine kinase CheA
MSEKDDDVANTDRGDPPDQPDQPDRNDELTAVDTAQIFSDLVSTDARNRAADIADRARERNLGRAAELAAWVTTAEHGSLSENQRSEAAEIAHQLAGSAGTFGYLGVTEIAREVERLFAEGEGHDCWAKAGDRVRDLVRCLHAPPEDLE